MKNKINILFLLITAGLLLTSITYLRNEFSGSENSSVQKAGQEEEATEAMESMQFFNEMRAFPDADIPPDKFYKAFEYSKNSMHELDQGDSPSEWTSIGPNNEGGRTLSLAIPPNDNGLCHFEWK